MKAKQKYFVTILALAVLYFVVAKLGLSMSFSMKQITTVGPPTGLAIAALLLYGKRLWPGIFLGAFLVNFLTTEPYGVAFGIAVGSTLEAVIATVFLRRIITFKPALDRLRGVLGLIVIAGIFCTMISASIGTTSQALGGTLTWNDQPTAWLLWWIGDMASVLLLTPFLLVWHDGWRQIARQSGLEFAVLLLSTVVVSAIIFFGRFRPLSNDPQLEYLIFPFVIWAAFRFKQLGVTAVSLIATIIAVLGTIGGGGPFAGVETTQQQFVTLFNMIIVSTSGMFLAVAVLQREFYEQGLIRQAEDLRLARDKIVLELDTETQNKERLKDSNERITKLLSQLLNEKSVPPNRD